MSNIHQCVLAAALSLLLASSSLADTPKDITPGDTQMNRLQKMIDVRRELSNEIFVPRKFLSPLKHNPREPIIEIVYTGDDYAWPVYAIGIYRGCLEKPSGHLTPDCSGLWHALQLRAPRQNAPRLRYDGSQLVTQIADKLLANPALNFKHAVTRSGLEWSIADLNSCDDAIALLEKFDDFLSIGLTQRPDYFLHADMISIKINKLQRPLTHKSATSVSTGKWAMELTKKLEPCWRAAPYPRPWGKYQNDAP